MWLKSQIEDETWLQKESRAFINHYDDLTRGLFNESFSLESYTLKLRQLFRFSELLSQSRDARMVELSVIIRDITGALRSQGQSFNALRKWDLAYSEETRLFPKLHNNGST